MLLLIRLGEIHFELYSTGGVGTGPSSISIDRGEKHLAAPIHEQKRRTARSFCERGLNFSDGSNRLAIDLHNHVARLKRVRGRSVEIDVGHHHSSRCSGNAQLRCDIGRQRFQRKAEFGGTSAL